jgi:transcriptional regulator with XRE-family HTH domain
MDKLIEWINQKLNENNLSIRKLAEKMGISDSNLSKILSGKVDPGVKFYIKLAEAFNEPASRVFRLAGILPSISDDDQMTFSELLSIVKKLTPQEREEVLRYASYHLWRRGDTSTSEETGPANGGEAAKA